MAHEVETMAWTNQVPWHGLGVQVADNLTSEQMMKAAKLDWTVEKAPLFVGQMVKDDEKQKTAISTNAKQCREAFALVRSSDHRVLDVVGPAYHPVQNHEAFAFFNEFLKAGDAKMETAGSLKNGKMVWGLASLQRSFKLKGNDEVKGYLLVSSPHQQGKAMTIQFTNIRVVCNNTLTAALSEKAAGHFRRAHRGAFDEVAIEDAKEALGLARDQFDAFEQFANKASKKKLDLEEQYRILAAAFQPDIAALGLEDQKKEANKGMKLAMAALDHAPGFDMPSAQGTAWGALNAVTYTTDHLLRGGADSRLHHAWFGKSKSMKAAAVHEINQML